METLATVGKAALQVAVGAAVKALGGLVTESKRAGKIDDSSLIPDALERHIQEVANWCSSYNFVGLSKPKNIDIHSIELSLSSMPRKLRGKGKGASQINEAELFTKREGFILLGDPGSGKTTTLKRVAQRLLTEPPKNTTDEAAFPLLVVLREMQKGTSLKEKLAEIIGLRAVKNTEEVITEIKPPGGSLVQKKTSRIVWRVGDLPLIDFIVSFLNTSKAVLLIDGLDEIATEQINEVNDTLRELCRKLDTPRIVLTCRSGAYNENFERLSVCELLPLSPQQVAEIAKFWLNDPKDFLQALDDLPYRDIVDRPLLLTYLLYLYSADNSLPEQPSSIYRKVVYRLLREWDEERRIDRRSQYSRFDVDRKMDFLSELAYQLTYSVRSKVFTESTLIKVYKKIHKHYRLPHGQYREVAREIETHTGILIESGLGRYEFSHLSIQEFFCGNYLARAPYPELMREYLERYTPPVAVACAMSSDPSQFLIELAENRKTHGFFNAESLGYFLSRLRLENPVLRPNIRLGYVVMLFFGMFYSSRRVGSDRLIERLLELYDVKGAVKLALADEDSPIPVVKSGNIGIFRINSSRFRNSMLFEELPIKLPYKFLASLKTKLQVTITEPSVDQSNADFSFDGSVDGNVPF